MSKMVNEDDHGALFALVACIEVVCNLLATVIFNSMYPATRYLVTPHGFCFFFMAGMLIIALVITVALRMGWYSSGGDSKPCSRLKCTVNSNNSVNSSYLDDEDEPTQLLNE
jgi:PCFT/HCP family folate transporter-like MFS transporter 1/3